MTGTGSPRHFFLKLIIPELDYEKGLGIILLAGGRETSFLGIQRSPLGPEEKKAKKQQWDNSE